MSIPRMIALALIGLIVAAPGLLARSKAPGIPPSCKVPAAACWSDLARDARVRNAGGTGGNERALGYGFMGLVAWLLTKKPKRGPHGR